MAGGVPTKKREREWSCEQEPQRTVDIADVVAKRSAEVSVLHPLTEAAGAVQPDVTKQRVAVPAFGAVVKAETEAVLANKRARVTESKGYNLVCELAACESAYAKAFSQAPDGCGSNLQAAYLAYMEVLRGLEEYTADLSSRVPNCDSKPSAPVPAPAPALFTTAVPASAPALFTTAAPAPAPFTIAAPAPAPFTIAASAPVPFTTAAPAPAPASALFTTAASARAAPAIIEDDEDDSEEEMQQKEFAASRGCASFIASTSGFSIAINAVGVVLNEGKKRV